MAFRYFAPDRGRRRTVGCLFLAVSVWFAAGACAPVTAPISKTAASPVPLQIALLPVADMARIYGSAQSVRCPLTGKVFVTGEISPALAALLTTEAETHLRALGYDLASPEAGGNAMAALSAETRSDRGERELVMAAARRLGAEAALVGYLYRSQERQGGRFAVRQPASVAYGLYLIDARSGRLLWSGEFDETQRSLDEDLFEMGTFLRRRGEWVDAAQMATASVREILSGFPKLDGDAGGAESDIRP